VVQSDNATEPAVHRAAAALASHARRELQAAVIPVAALCARAYTYTRVLFYSSLSYVFTYRYSPYKREWEGIMTKFPRLNRPA
jgi:hypothetical protein